MWVRLPPVGLLRGQVQLPAPTTKWDFAILPEPELHRQIEQKAKSTTDGGRDETNEPNEKKREARLQGKLGDGQYMT